MQWNTRALYRAEALLLRQIADQHDSWRRQPELRDAPDSLILWSQVRRIRNARRHGLDSLSPLEQTAVEDLLAILT